MGAVNTIEARRKALEDQIADHTKTLTSMNFRSRTLAQQLDAIIAEELASKSKQKHIERINSLLDTARQALVEAGEIGEEYGIDFSFQGPRGVEDFNVN